MRSARVLVVDETGDLCRQAERVAAGLRPRPEVVRCQSLDDVEAILAEHGAVDVVVAGPAASDEEALRELRRLRVKMPQAAIILAFEKWRSGSLRQTIRTGAVDIVRLPVNDDVLRDAIAQALEVRWATPAEPVPGRPAPRTNDGRVIAVVSGSGGCGKTFLATNLAYYLHSRLQKRVCLLDLDLQFGELSTALRLQPKYTMADLAAADDDAELGARLEEYLVVHETGIHLLAAPDEPAEADAIDASAIARIVRAARARFDYVVIDAPATFSEAVLTALEHVDRVVALATLDLPSVRKLGVLLATLKQLKVPAEIIDLVLNKVEPDVGIDVERVTKYFPQGFALVIPYSPTVNRSLNMGMPTLAYAPRDDVGTALAAGLPALVASTTSNDGAGSPDEAPGARRRRFGRAARKSA